MLELLHRRYGQKSYNGGVNAPRYICAEHVRARAGFDCRTADFVAVDTWESSMRQGWLTVHGVEVKVSRSDWLRELKDPRKAADGMPYATRLWLAIPDPSMVREGELPPGWGLLCPAGSRGLVAKIQAAGTGGGEPLTPSETAALLRAVAKVAANRATWSAAAKPETVTPAARIPGDTRITMCACTQIPELGPCEHQRAAAPERDDGALFDLEAS